MLFGVRDSLFSEGRVFRVSEKVDLNTLRELYDNGFVTTSNIYSADLTEMGKRFVSLHLKDEVDAQVKAHNTFETQKKEFDAWFEGLNLKNASTSDFRVHLYGGKDTSCVVTADYMTFVNDELMYGIVDIIEANNELIKLFDKAVKLQREMRERGWKSV